MVATAELARIDSIANIPVGGIIDYGGTTLPAGYLWPAGQNVSRTTYAALFAAYSTTYGAGDGSTTFGLPDLRGRVVAGQDDMNGSSANRLTGASGGVDGDVLGASGGAETHTLTTAQLASHNHTFSRDVQGITGAILSGAGGTATYYAEGLTYISAATGTNSSGSGSAHNNVQPTFILNKIIYAGV